VLKDYFKRIGGRPETSKLGKRKSAANLKQTSDSPVPKRSKRNNTNDEESVDGQSQATSTWTPKSENWEREIEKIDTVERDGETGKLWAFILFKNNMKRTKVGMDKVYKHCPLAMLKFYESHLLVLTSSLKYLLRFPSSERRPMACLRDPLRSFLTIETDQNWRKIGNSMAPTEAQLT
jgi:Chromo shadow domain